MKPADYWKQVREVCDKATAGPWKHVYVPGRRTPGWPGEPGEHRLVPNGHMWAPIDAHDPDSEDAAFIAMARTALPEALDEIDSLRAGQQNDDRDHRRLTAEIERLREVLGRLSSPSWPCEVVQDMNAMSRRADAQLVAEKTVGEMSGIARAALGKP